MYKDFTLNNQNTTTSIPVSIQRKDAKYDLIKFILSLFVVAIHSALYPMALYPWLRVAVPLFFIMSSYFVFSKLCNAPENMQKLILKQYIIRNLQLYLCWLVIQLPIVLYIRKDIFFSDNFLVNIFNVLRSFLFKSTFTASWFIMGTVIGVLIIHYLSKLLRNDFFLLLISFLVFCLVTLASSYKSVISDTFIMSIINTHTYIFGGLICSFPASLFWVFIGRLFAKHKIEFKSLGFLISLIIISCIALFAEWRFVISLNGSYNNDSYFMLAPLCFFLFAGIQKIKPIYWNNSVFFKRASTIIYVTHGSVLLIVTKAISILLNSRIPPLSFTITSISCITIYICIELLNKKCHSNRINKILNMLY